MKKATIFGMVFLLTFIHFTNNSPHVLAAEFCDQYQNVDKIYWDELELKKGQLGRLHVKQDTNMYSLDGDKKIYYSTLKQGNTFRIYSFLPNKLGVGAGYYIDRDAKIEYETPSKTKLDAVKCLDNKKKIVSLNSKFKGLILLDTDRTEKNLLDELKKDISILMANQTGTIEDYRMYAEVSQDLSIIDRKIDYLGWNDVYALYNSLQNIIKLINSTLSTPKEEEISQYVIDQSAAIKGSKDNINRIINKVNNLKKSPSNKVNVANNIYVKYYKNSYESMNQDEYNTVIKIVDESLKQIEKIEFGGEFSEYYYQYLNGERATDRGRDLKSYGLTSADHDIGQLVKAGIKREEIIKLYKTNEVASSLTRNIPSQNLNETFGYEYYKDTFTGKLFFKKYPTNYEFAFSAYDALVRRINDLDSMAQVYAAVYNSIGYETTIYQRHVYIKINGKWWSKDFYQVDEKGNVIRL